MPSVSITVYLEDPYKVRDEKSLGVKCLSEMRAGGPKPDIRKLVHVDEVI